MARPLDLPPGPTAVLGGTAELLADADRDGSWMLLVNDTPQSHVDLDDPDAPGVRVRPADRPRPRPRRRAGRRRSTPSTSAAAPSPSPATSRSPGPARGSASWRSTSRSPTWSASTCRCPAAPRIRVRADDARVGLAALHTASADVVVCDVFAGARTPAHLTSAEFAADVHRVLRPGGVYAANVADGPPLRFARAQVATLRSVFRHVCLLAEPGTLRGRRFGNLVAVASDAELPIDDYVRRCARDPMPARVVHGRGSRRRSPARPAPSTTPRPSHSPEPPDGVFTR